MKPAVVVAALCAASCGAPPSQAPGIVHEPCGPLRVVLTGTVSSMQRDATARALEQWNGLGFTQLSLAGGEAISVRFEHAADLFHGVYDPDTGDVIINDVLTDPSEATVVIAHELGHAMGLAHVPESVRASVMNPGNLSTPPLAADSSELSARCGQ